MVQKYITQTIDDIDGTILEPDNAETIRLAVDGTTYALDLSLKNAEKFRKDISKYTEKARLERGVAATAKASTATSKKKAPSDDLNAIREWANKNGFTVSTRGRIPAAVTEAYADAHK